jgi:hypothetical protein
MESWVRALDSSTHIDCVGKLKMNIVIGRIRVHLRLMQMPLSAFTPQITWAGMRKEDKPQHKSVRRSSKSKQFKTQTYTYIFCDIIHDWMVKMNSCICCPTKVGGSFHWRDVSPM